MTRIIDAHNHLGGPDKKDGMFQSAKEIITNMDADGVDMAVVFPFNEPNPGNSFSRCNDWIYDVVSYYPERMIGFARLDPNFGEQAVSELRRCVKYPGLAGIKLHPSAQNFSIGDVNMRNIVEYVSNEKPDMPILFDNGKSASPNSHIGKLAEEYDEVTFILAHMYGKDFIDVTASHDNIFIQTTSMPQVSVIKRCVDELGANRVIMGSDSPYHSTADEIRKIEYLDIQDDEKRLIMGGNMERLMGMKKE